MKRLESDEEILEALKRIKKVDEAHFARFGITFELDDGTYLFIEPFVMDAEDGLAELSFMLIPGDQGDE